MGLTPRQPRRPCPRLDQAWRSFAGRVRFPPVSSVCSFSSPFRDLTLGPPGENTEQDQVAHEFRGKVRYIWRSFALSSWRANTIVTCVWRSDFVSEGRLHRRRETARFPECARLLCWADRVGRRIPRT